ncbi:MAG TPA: DotU/TssL family secretion system protein [Methylomirabilota bacterium]|nr:DotU/TssL family secretion system protein [Methylomirabilota bacterium]
MATRSEPSITLREVFTPLFARLLFLSSNPAAGPTTFSGLRRELRQFLDEQESLVKRRELDPQDYDNARFAVVAWLDEIILRATHDTNPELYQQWRHSPLQSDLYKTTKAGELFFERLENLQPRQKGVIEVYHLCLCLGFRGRYYDEEQDHKLVELRHEYAQHLPVSFPDLYEIEKNRERLTPQPYEVQPPPAKTRPQPPSPMWMGLAAAALLALLVYLVWPTPRCGNQKLDEGEQCDASARAQCPGKQVCQADCTCPPGPSPSALQAALKPFECKDITVTNLQGGVVTLGGRVQSEDQRQQVRQAVKAVPGVIEVQDSFELIPRPFCEVIELLTPFQHSGNSHLTINPQKSCRATYYQNENLIVDVSATKPLHYVYVDYYTADKKGVAHLLPNTKQTTNFSKEALSLKVGDPTDPTQQHWSIRSPFGLELVTVIASSRQLITPPRLEPEPATVYLELLRGVLPSDPTTAEITAAYCFITSKEKEQ